ncbi:uncharacterized protein LOC135391772 [Ornithodoros turicata]|uniref:uncharacterized protein LOC135391772 n=1 Tax=Ornithodoros turicata TaxID=34597 RepID=UPI003138A699
MADNSAAEKAALHSVWPNATQLLCHFHVAQAEWRWLTSAKNVSPGQRRQLMSTFQKVMYADTAEGLEKAKEELQALSHDPYRARVQAFLQNEQQWVLLFRRSIITRGHNTNNFAEACIRVLKDIILCRLKAFNVVAMVDFVSVPWEKYFKERLLRHAHNRVAADHLGYDRLLRTMPEGATVHVTCLGDGSYAVPSATTLGKSYEVNSEVGLCSCPAGSQGAFCKHQALVHKIHGGMFPNAPVLSSEDRMELGRIALGDNCPPLSFFAGFRDMEQVKNAGQSLQPSSLPESNTVNMDSECCATSGDSSQEPCTSGAAQASTRVEGLTIRDFIKELERGDALVGQNETYSRCLRKAVLCLKKARTETHFVGAMMSISAALGSATRRSGYIKVQPTVIARRRKGLTRGAKRVPAGRPPKRSATKQAKKRVHKLQVSVQSNVPHAKSHGEGH